MPPSSTLQWADYAVLGGYVVATLLLGIWVGRSVNGARDFFLASRTLPWWAIGLSLVVTDLAGTDLIGGGTASHRFGLAAANLQWIGAIPAILLGAFVIIPHLWSTGITTLPELLERRFNVSVRIAVSTCWVISLACGLGAMLLGTGKLLQDVTGLPLDLGILGVALVVGLYCWSGGLAAGVYTGVLQAVVMLAGLLLAVGVGLWQIGGFSQLEARVASVVSERARVVQATTNAGQTGTGGTQAVLRQADQIEQAPQEYYSLVRPIDTPSPYAWPAVLFGMALIMSPGYWIGQQSVVQRALGAQSRYQAQASYVWAAMLMTIIPLLIALPELIVVAVSPSLPTGDYAVPRVMLSLLPAGLRGVFVAAILSALLASVGSALNAAVTLLTHDFYQRILRPEADDQQLLKVGRMVTVTLSVWSVGFAWFLSMQSLGSGAVFHIIGTFFQGPAIVVLLMALFSTRITSGGALGGFVFGVLTSLLLFALNHSRITTWLQTPRLFPPEQAELYYSFWSAVMTWGVAEVVTYFSPVDQRAKVALVLRHRTLPVPVRPAPARLEAPG